MTPAQNPHAAWRTPLLIVLSGCIIGLLSFGPRSALGLFLVPASTENGWSRDVFSFAIALQNLMWGIGQPFAGAIVDRFGSTRVLWAGAAMYGLGLFVMTLKIDPLLMQILSGLLIGFGLAGVSFNIVLAAFGKLLPESSRTLAFGLGTAASSFGQFVFAPLSSYLIDLIGWKATLTTYGLAMVAIIPFALVVATRPGEGTMAVNTPTARQRTAGEVMADAFRHPSYVFLVLGFFTCGFQLAFVTAHMPAYLADMGISAAVGAWALALIGIFNIAGSLSAGWAAGVMPKRWLLVANYAARAVAIALFMLVPISNVTTLLFAAVMGLLWLSTVPPTSGLVAVMFGTRHMAMLYGFCFFSHQVGGFLGVWIGGLLYVKTGSYVGLWWLGALFGVLSALINIPIKEKPVTQPAMA